ncbi:GyrI-like domain-containing protein [Sinanaerobacter chloroacetimidivorans]|uniref:GyrI-like domain-containing protein n=1 Tax=Sinanaerobacter chloroacetimidivorans TaxID=2818044 RepID=A0A8J7W531_9FIRM|nr:GyrI-like domain-containing protein [Sinanaerobacter chloroacetimidivorans]MBR0599105.1 GyrI-like domain-containing protein [Sinanaerobacter chloroacetimidivorans]
MTQVKMDYKKEFPDLYQPKTVPGIVLVPEIKFIMVDGKGNPNLDGGEYERAVELLYALSYTIKMSPKSGREPQGFFDYVVPPLEGLWWLEDPEDFDFTRKDRFCWTSMIRQPEFVSDEVFQWAMDQVAGKKPHLDTAKARLQDYKEGLCIQMLHIGPYDEEPKSIAQMDTFMREQGYRSAICDILPDGTVKRHHEIYLGDPRKTAPAKLKTILRHPVKEGK